MPAIARDIHIDAGVEDVAAYVAHVPNLPSWTTFFREVGEPDGDRYPVVSIMGPIVTWTRRDPAPDGGLVVSLCSEIRGAEERATVALAAAGGGARVTFTVTLPEGLPPAVAEGQHAEMGGELAALKRLVEHARAAV